MTPVEHTRTNRQLAPISSLDRLLIIPIPKAEPARRTLWMDFLSDLSFTLPAFGTVFGLLLLFGQSPFIGAAVATVCPIILAARIHRAFQARRQRRRVNAMIHRHRRVRLDGAERSGPSAKEMPDVIYCPVPPVNRIGHTARTG